MKKAKIGKTKRIGPTSSASNFAHRMPRKPRESFYCRPGSRKPKNSKDIQISNWFKQTALSVTTTAKVLPRKSTETLDEALNAAASTSRNVMDLLGSQASSILNTSQGLLASALSIELNHLLQDLVKGPATIYDKAMDAEYLATHIGGGNHRMFDGGHTLLGAFRAVRNASPDDTVVQEAMGLLEGLFKDMTTAKGLPLANWDKTTYDHVSGFLSEHLGISKKWFYDLNSYDATELIGSSIGVIAVALNWNKASTEQFASLVGGMGLSALRSANPLLIVVTIVALARSFHKAHESGEYIEMIDGGIKGGIGSGATLAAVSVVGVLGGPAGLGLLVGITAGAMMHWATKDLSVRQFGETVAALAQSAAAEAQSLIKRKHEPENAPKRNDENLVAVQGVWPRRAELPAP